MPTLMVTGSFANLLAKDFEKIFFDNYMRKPPQWSEVANVMNMSDAWIKEGEVYPLSKLQEMHEGQEIRFEGLKQGNTKTIYPKNFGLGAQMTRNMYRDDKTGIMKQLMAELGKAANYSTELEFWDLLNSGFVTTYRSGIDSKALFADDHTTNSGSTIDNQGTAGSLSTSTLQAAYNYFENLVNESGVPIKMIPKKLIIPPALRWKAEELMLSEYNPENAQMQYNTTKGMNLTYQVVNYLTSTTAWFIVADEHDLRFLWREKPAFESSDDFNTGNALYKVTTRFVADFVHYRGHFGNAGA